MTKYQPPQLRYVAPLKGPMCDYDFQTMPYAEALLSHLKSRPSFKWWNRWFNRPTRLRELEPDISDAFMGWRSFVCRNSCHRLSEAVFDEFKRVYGREATIID